MNLFKSRLLHEFDLKYIGGSGRLYNNSFSLTVEKGHFYLMCGVGVNRSSGEKPVVNISNMTVLLSVRPEKDNGRYACVIGQATSTTTTLSTSANSEQSSCQVWEIIKKVNKSNLGLTKVSYGNSLSDISNKIVIAFFSAYDAEYPTLTTSAEYDYSQSVSGDAGARCKCNIYNTLEHKQSGSMSIETATALYPVKRGLLFYLEK